MAARFMLTHIWFTLFILLLKKIFHTLLRMRKVITALRRGVSAAKYKIHNSRRMALSAGKKGITLIHVMQIIDLSLFRVYLQG